MKKEEIDEIIACLPSERTLFYYFKERYALMLLAWFAGSGMKISAIKKSPYAKLLDKPAVRDVLAQSGSMMLNDELLHSYWPERSECYRLTLGSWGGGHLSWSQTSRKGYSLVLQLNFSSKHNRHYHRMIPREFHPFEYDSHPIAREGFLTLAWARIDLNLDDGEALIEEIQNDWIRRVLSCRSRIQWYEANRKTNQYYEKMNLTAKAMENYVEASLKPHIESWDEAMLSAVIWFLKEEIGIDRIFYHTYESGARLKRITGTLPPRSIYTKLPKKLCFMPTADMPKFLQREFARSKKRRKETYRFQLLEFPDEPSLSCAS